MRVSNDDDLCNSTISSSSVCLFLIKVVRWSIFSSLNGWELLRRCYESFRWLTIVCAKHKMRKISHQTVLSFNKYLTKFFSSSHNFRARSFNCYINIRSSASIFMHFHRLVFFLVSSGFFFIIAVVEHYRKNPVFAFVTAVLVLLLSLCLNLTCT